MTLRTSVGWALLGPVVWISILLLAAGGRADGAVEKAGTVEFVTHQRSPTEPFNCHRGPTAAALEGRDERAPHLDRSSRSKAASLPQSLFNDV